MPYSYFNRSMHFQIHNYILLLRTKPVCIHMEGNFRRHNLYFHSKISKTEYIKIIHLTHTMVIYMLVEAYRAMFGKLLLASLPRKDTNSSDPSRNTLTSFPVSAQSGLQHVVGLYISSQCTLGPQLGQLPQSQSVVS